MKQTNIYGDPAFKNNKIIEPNEPYWKNVDYVFKTAEAYGLYLAVLPAWCRTYMEALTGDKEKDRDLTTKIMETDTIGTYIYGKFVGERYKKYDNLIWVLGGDAWGTRDTIYHQQAQGIADGVAKGDFGKVLMTYHPKGGTYRPPASSSGEFYHNKVWLDFNMIQSGHRFGNRNFERIYEDYLRKSTKPTLESEPCYEMHPNIHDYKNGEFNAWHLRQQAYWSVLAGACGFSYGATGIYDMVRPDRSGKLSHFKNYWYNALDYEGANDMIHLKNLFEKMNFQTPALIPNQQLLLSKIYTVNAHVQIAHASNKNYLLAYFTDGSPAIIDISKLGKGSFKAWWYSPRDGKLYDSKDKDSSKAFEIIKNPIKGKQFRPPFGAKNDNDWVLVLDRKNTFKP